MLKIIPRLSIPIFIFSLAAASEIKAQAPLFSNYTGNQPWLNPAFTGTSGSFRFMYGYQAQWAAIPGSPRNSDFSIDAGFGKGRFRQGAGLEFFFNRLWEANAGQNTLRGNYAFSIPLFNSQCRLSFGLSGGISYFTQQYNFSYYGHGYLKMHYRFSVAGGLAYFSKNSWLSLSITNTPVYVFYNPIPWEDWASYPLTIPQINISGGHVFNFCKSNPAYRWLLSGTSILHKNGFNLRANSEFWLKSVILGLGGGVYTPGSAEPAYYPTLSGTLGIQGFGRFKIRYSLSHDLVTATNAYGAATHEFSLAFLLGKQVTSVPNPWMIPDVRPRSGKNNPKRNTALPAKE